MKKYRKVVQIQGFQYIGIGMENESKRSSKSDPKTMPNGTGGAQGPPRERPEGTLTRFGALR